MKSSKQRRKEIKERRLARARKLARVTIREVTERPGIERSDHDKLKECGGNCLLPEYYKDLEFRCRDCGSLEVWTAKQQKWWYEEAKGHLDSTAIRCRPCRRKEQERKKEARRTWAAGIARKRSGDS
jgi:hypothetical protein